MCAIKTNVSKASAFFKTFVDQSWEKNKKTRFDAILGFELTFMDLVRSARLLSFDLITMFTSYML